MNTPLIDLVFLISSNGFLSSKTKSASLPGSIVPFLLAIPRYSAGFMVAVCNAAKLSRPAMVRSAVIDLKFNLKPCFVLENGTLVNEGHRFPELVQSMQEIYGSHDKTF